MPKVKSNQIDKKEKYRIVEEMFEVFSRLKSKSDLMGFMVGLLTPSEVLMIARRMQVAKMILEGRTYEVIEKKLKVSHMTINRVELWLRSEKMDEFDLEGKFKNISKRKTNSKNSRSGLDKYAHHKFLKELLKL